MGLYISKAGTSLDTRGAITRGIYRRSSGRFAKPAIEEEIFLAQSLPPLSGGSPFAARTPFQPRYIVERELLHSFHRLIASLDTAIGIYSREEQDFNFLAVQNLSKPSIRSISFYFYFIFLKNFSLNHHHKNI